jgi:hypothetical protein
MRPSVVERYQTDPAFRMLVDSMTACIEQAQFTPSEIREAAMLAQIRFEETHIRPHIYYEIGGMIDPRR